MSCEAIEVGAFTWSRIQRLYDPDTVTHWQRCEFEGLQCPQEVFTQLFHLSRLCLSSLLGLLNLTANTGHRRVRIALRLPDVHPLHYYDLHASEL
jgi:hypothetical protein